MTQSKPHMKKKTIIMLAAAIAAAACITTSAQTRRMAVTGLSEVNLREEPDYTAEMGTQALMGTVVEITGEKDYWRQVTTPEPYSAWCTELGLTEMKHDRLAAYIAAPKYICTSLHSSVRRGASANSEQMCDLSSADLVRIVMTEGKNQKPSIKKGWAEVMLPSGTKGWAPENDLADFTSWAQAFRTKESPEAIIATAKSLLGVPYLWGGASSKGVDCSGFTRLVWFMNGRLIPRNASQQAAIGREIIMQADHAVTPDSNKIKAEMLKRIKHLKPGDLIFFGTPETFFKKGSITHVGIYLGSGKFIHSSHFVRISSLIPGEEDYYDNSYRLIKAQRLFSWTGEGITPVIKSPAYFLQEE